MGMETHAKNHGRRDEAKNLTAMANSEINQTQCTKW